MWYTQISHRIWQLCPFLHLGCLLYIRKSQLMTSAARYYGAAQHEVLWFLFNWFLTSWLHESRSEMFSFFLRNLFLLYTWWYRNENYTKRNYTFNYSKSLTLHEVGLKHLVEKERGLLKEIIHSAFQHETWPPSNMEAQMTKTGN